MNVKIELVSGGTLPEHQTGGAAALDCFAREGGRLRPGESCVVPLGFKVALLPGTAGFILPRSGRAATLGVTIGNSPGLIDPDFRGEVKAILSWPVVPPAALSSRSHLCLDIEPGDRVCQFMVVPALLFRWDPVDILPATDRGEGGFGSTGV